ncbi:hypothetical protein GE061_018151 [Apolygus lucorum]|uniref:Ras suppressor protein 1 n=1 Tax=Apolygus lucorum TaxID=248454 RepID=A0A6A4JG75_APOLU|nr:hypothetical protein GE061_018151 [Apolygus lucorum]
MLVLRDNDLIEIPKEIGELTRLRELHIQANRLTLLPPEIGNLDFSSDKSEFKLHLNDWVTPIQDQLQTGIPRLMDYIRSETYRYLYNRQVALKNPPPPKIDKTKKVSRLKA